MNALPLFMAGLHFGILQSCLFFASQVHITATWVGFFLVVLFWMLGVIIGLRGWPAWSLIRTLTASLAAYILLTWLASSFDALRLYLPLYGLLVVVAGIPAGTFFRQLAGRVASGSLFLHENNGFVFGLLLGMLGFVKWGTSFMHAAPLLSFAGVLLAMMSEGLPALLFLTGSGLLCARLGNSAASWTMAAACATAAVAWRIQPPGPTGQELPDESPVPDHHRRNRWILAIAGCNLMMLQFFIVREFSSVIAASEISILLVSTAYFAGYSVGYAFSNRMPQRLLRGVLCGAFFFHTALLLFVKFSAGTMIAAGWGMAALVTLLVLATLCTGSVYSTLLPRLGSGGKELSLVSAYATDLLGAAVGTVLMLLAATYLPAALLPAYLGLMLLMALLQLKTSRWRGSMALIGLATILGVVGFQQQLARLATEDYYRFRGYDNPRLLFAGNSIYHSVEIIDTHETTGAGSAGARISFLNGVPYFRTEFDADRGPGAEASLSEFTWFLAELPARMVSRQKERKLRILILGGGSLSTLRRVAPWSKKTTLVEIDPLVVQTSRIYWSDQNRTDQLTNYEIIIDDAKHYLRTSTEQFDLIINDISAPYYLGTALCHSREFYELVQSRLATDGLFAESTQGRPRSTRPNSQGMRILRGVADVFPHYRVVDCREKPRGRRGFVYATDKFPLSTDLLTSIMKTEHKHDGTATYWEGSSHFRLHRTEPFSLTNMETILSGNIWRIESRLRLSRGAGRRGQGHRFFSRLMDPENPDHSRLLLALHKHRMKVLLSALPLLVLSVGLSVRRGRPAD